MEKKAEMKDPCGSIEKRTLTHTHKHPHTMKWKRQQEKDT